MWRSKIAVFGLLFASPAFAGASSSQHAAVPNANAATQAAAAAASGAAVQQGEARPLTEAERAQALLELQDLQARMTALEQRLGVTPPSQLQVTPAAPRPPRDHNLELYGFIQLDAIQDFKRVNPDWDATLRPSRIPTLGGQFGSDGQSIFSVRQSRLGVKATGTLQGKPYEAKFEFDLYGTGVDAGQTTMRVRHAYASWGPFSPDRRTPIRGRRHLSQCDRLLGSGGNGLRAKPANPLDLLGQERLEGCRPRTRDKRHRHGQPSPDRRATASNIRNDERSRTSQLRSATGQGDMCSLPNPPQGRLRYDWD